MRKLIVLIVMALLCSPSRLLGGEGDAAGSTDRATTVKSSKSNSQDRSAAPDSGASEATTVKSGKSNSSDRTADPALGGSDEAATVKGSKSNTSERR